MALNLNTKKLSTWIGGMALAVMAQGAWGAPVNLVGNGNFDQALINGWSTTTGTDATADIGDAEDSRSGPASSGSAAFLYTSSGDSLSQVTGVLDSLLTYDLRFFLKPSLLVGFVAEFRMLGAADVNLGLVNFAPIGGTEEIEGWVGYGGVFSHVGLRRVELTFSYSNPCTRSAGTCEVYLDDVSITARPANDVPEPGTLALVGLALAGAGYVRRRKA